MEIAGAYREIEKRLSRIDFPLLFHGFHRFPFALYDETRAYLDGEMIDKPAGFLGNTSILFREMHTITIAPTAVREPIGSSYAFSVRMGIRDQYMRRQKKTLVNGIATIPSILFGLSGIIFIFW